MAEPGRTAGRELAVCRHCSCEIERDAGEFWRHRQNQHPRCLPGTRNAQMGTPTSESVKRV